MAQTTYTDTPVVGFAGQKADAARNDDVMSFFCEEAGTGGVPFGAFVCRGTADDQCELPDGAGDVAAGALLGVALHQSMKTDGAYALQEVVSVMRTGRVFVVIEDAHSAGDPIFVRHTAAGAEVLGAARTDADTADAVQINGRILSTGDAGAIALCEIDLQGQ